MKSRVKTFRLPGMAGIALGCLLAAAPAWAQSDIRALLDRLERMERDLDTLQRQVYRGGGGGSTTVITSPALGGGTTQSGAAAPTMPSDAAGRIEVRLGTVEDQIRRLTGQIEENQFRIGQVKDQMERLQADTDLRFQELQHAPSAAATAAPPAAGMPGVLGTMPQKELEQAAPPKPVLEGATAKDQYEYAYGLVLKDRDAAERALAAFLGAHPKDPLASNAYYWLGETYFVKGDFKQAAVQFLEGYRQFPKSQKASHNLLKLGVSMARMDDTKGACAAFARLGQEYPDAEATVKRTSQAERQRLKCP